MLKEIEYYRNRIGNIKNRGVNSALTSKAIKGIVFPLSREDVPLG